MIRKVKLKGSTISRGEVPKVGSKLRIHNPKFPNSDYTKIYSKIPADTVYSVIKSNQSAHNIVITGPSGISGVSRFSCSRGFDKHFTYDEERHDLSP